MRILSIKDAARVVDARDMESFINSVDWQLPDPIPSYFLPKDSGAKVGLARIIGNTFLDRGSCFLWITGTGVWPSAEHMDVFTRYRLSFGEQRSVAEAPVHFFEPTDDRSALISVLSLALFFAWDVEIVSEDRSSAVTISHDEWIEYRFSSGQENLGFAANLTRLCRGARARSGEETP